jgi:hypothetical protein
MGNQLAQPSKPPSEHLTELPNVVLKDSLGVCAEAASSMAIVSRFPLYPGGGRFLKTLLCVHDEGGLVVVKVRMQSRPSITLSQAHRIHYCSIGVLQTGREPSTGTLQEAAATHQVRVA